MACVVFLAGCTGEDIAVKNDRPLNAGNDGRIQQYLEETIMDSENVVCNFDWLNQPNGNVVEVMALCEDFTVAGEKLEKGAVKSFPAKITFANPSLHVVPLDGAEYMSVIEEKFSKISVEKIKNEESNIVELEEKNLVRAKKWLLGE